MVEELSCSFCGRKKSETKILVAGLNAHICDRCIEQAVGIIQEEKSHFDIARKSFDNVSKWVNQAKATRGDDV